MRTVFAMVVLVATAACGGAGAETGEATPDTSGPGEALTTPQATAPAQTPAPSEATNAGSNEPAALPDPCAVLSETELAPWIEPGTEGVESAYTPESIRECDWFSVDKGLAAQIIDSSNLDLLAGWGDVVEDVPGHARETKVVYLEDGDGVVAVGVDAGRRVVLLYTVQHVTKGSPELDELVSLALAAADRVDS